MNGNGHFFQPDLFPEERERIRGMVHRPDHSTSIDAALDVEPIKLKLQREIVEAFKQLGPMTDEQLERLPQFRHYGQTTVSKRRTELYQKRIVVCVGYTLNSHSKRMKVWNLRENLRL